MTYELAKKLKDAGFPQENLVFYWCTDEKKVAIQSYCYPKGIHKCSIHIGMPTLSELIEACGEGFGELWHPRGMGKDIVPKYTAIGYYKGKNGEIQITGEGETPEEAVANLWLELKKK